MSKGRHARRRRDERSVERQDAPAEENGDFADEHSSTTFADEMPGGPEGRAEPETPTGRGGDGGMDPERSDGSAR